MAHRRAHIVVGLGFGDEGKGTTVDYLTRKTGAKLIVRYNGGAQAVHNVVTPDGVHHAFSQFGAGMLADPQIQTFLSRYMVIHPEGLLREAAALGAHIGGTPLKRVIIDERALIITPFHQVANRLRELARGDFRHGSCGVGVGEVASDKGGDLALHAGDLYDFNNVIAKLEKIRESRADLAEYVNKMKIPGTDRMINVFQDRSYVQRTAEYLRSFSKLVSIFPWYRIGEVFENIDDIIFEGAQGTLLDEVWGFHPYTTWSNCTTSDAFNLLAQDASWDGEITTYGIVRAYGTRHGPGPFPTEDNHLAGAIKNQGEHNKTHDWQGNFRIGWFDAVLTRYALRANGGLVDKVVVTNLDRIDRLDKIKVCHSYEGDLVKWMGLLPSTNVNSLSDMEALTEQLLKVRPIYDEIDFRDVVERIGREIGHKVDVASFGPTWKDKLEPT